LRLGSVPANLENEQALSFSIWIFVPISGWIPLKEKLTAGSFAISFYCDTQKYNDDFYILDQKGAVYASLGFDQTREV
jgi:hypothetical protein